MKTKNILLLGAAIFAMGVVACGDDSETTGSGGGTTSGGTEATTGATTTSTGSPTTTAGTGGEGGNGTGGEGGNGTGGEGGQGGEGGSGPPAVPELGLQLERMGRPAINTALNETFITLAGGTLGPSTDPIRSESENNYNEAINGSEDAQAFITTHALQLTVLDSLDGVCGNQPLWGFGAEAGDCDDSVTGQPVVCYGTLATVLNNDALWVKTEYDSCQIYLGVEADTAALLNPDSPLPANEDCGGRRPIDDVIETTYSVVSGALNVDGNLFGFDDGITPPADLHPDTFPYLAAPNE